MCNSAVETNRTELQEGEFYIVIDDVNDNQATICRTRVELEAYFREIGEENFRCSSWEFEELANNHSVYVANRLINVKLGREVKVNFL